MQSGEGDVAQLTGEYVVAVKRLRRRLSGVLLPEEEVIAKRIENDVTEVKKVLNYEGDLATMPETSEFFAMYCASGY